MVERYRFSKNHFIADKVRLLVIGIVSLVIITLLTCFFLGIEVNIFVQINRKSGLRKRLTMMVDLTKALRAETGARLDAVESYRQRPPVIISEDYVEDTDAKLGQLLDLLRDFMEEDDYSKTQSQIEAKLSAYRGSIGAATVLHQQELVELLTATAFSTLLPHFTERLQYSLRYYLVQQAYWAQTSLAARLANVLELNENLVMQHVINGLGRAVAVAKTMTLYLNKFKLDYLAANILIEHSEDVLRRMLVIGPRTDHVSKTVLTLYENRSRNQTHEIVKSFNQTEVTTNTHPSLLSLESIDQLKAILPKALNSLGGLQNALNTEITKSVASSGTAGWLLALFAVALVAAAACTLGAVYVLRRYSKRTRRAIRLLNSFGDIERSRAMIEEYRPVLNNMRTNKPLPPPITDADRKFHAAARFIFELRPYAPQGLFGELHDRHRHEPCGRWDLTAQSARLEMGMSLCNCTLLTIAFSSPNMRYASANNARAVMSEMCCALQIITREVNGSGGIIYSVNPGGVVIAAWNATNTVDQVAVVAIRACHKIDQSLGELGFERDLNLSTNFCMIGNVKVGTKKHVMIVGGPFDISERLLLLNEEHAANLVIDSDTFKELPRAQQRSCKPIAIISGREGGAPVVAMAADENEALQGDQLKQYTSAFALYQNKMIIEALNEFDKYLQAYPKDQSASWLREYVLQPLQKRRGERLASSQYANMSFMGSTSVQRKERDKERDKERKALLTFSSIPVYQSEEF